MKDDYKGWQAAIVAVLVRKTNELEPKINKADLAKEIGISFPTLKKIYDGESDLTIPIWWAWCRVLDVKAEDVAYEARERQITKAGEDRELSPLELFHLMPREVAANIKYLMTNIARMRFEVSLSGSDLGTKTITKQEMCDMGWVRDQRNPKGE